MPDLPLPGRRITKSAALYWRLWHQYANRKGLKGSDAEARHAFHRFALGYDRSHSTMAPREFDIIYAALRAGIRGEPFDRDAYLSAATSGARRRKVHAILKLAPWAYVQEIAKDRWQANDWTNLPVASLEQLRLTVIERARAHRRTHGPKATFHPYQIDDNNPF